MRRALVAAAFALCASTAHGADAVAPTWDYPSIALEVRFLPTMREVAETCAKLGAWGGDVAVARKTARGRPIGCALTYHDARKCVVYVARPEFVDDERVTMLGHEVFHCLAGEYHAGHE